MSLNQPCSQPQHHLLSLIQSLQLSNSQLTLLSQKYRKQIQHNLNLSKSQISLLVQQNTRLLSLNSKLQHSSHKYHHQLQEKEKIIDELKGKAEEIEGKLKEVGEEYGGYWTQMSMLKNKNKELGGKVRKLKEEGREKDIRIGYLENQLEFRRKEVGINRRGVGASKEREGIRRNVSMSSMNNVNRSSNNVSRSKSRGDRMVGISKNKLREEIECTLSTLDEMKILTEYQQIKTKEELKIKHQQFMMLKEEFMRMKELYQKEIRELRRENRELREEIGNKTERKQNRKDSNLDELYYYLEMINNSLVFKLPYLESLKPQLSISTHKHQSHILTLFSNLQLIFTQLQSLQSQQTLCLESTQFTQQTHNKYLQEIHSLHRQIQQMNYQQQEESQKLGEEFNELERERLKMIDALQERIREQEERIQEMEGEREGVLARVIGSSRESGRQKDREIVVRMLEVNEENQMLKLRNFEVMELLQGLLYFTASTILQTQKKFSLNKYYHICQSYYWSKRQPSIPSPSPKSKLKKILRAVLFVSSLKVSKNKRISNQKLVISNFRQFQSNTNKRFLNLLSRHSDYSGREENRMVEQFRVNGGGKNIYEEMIKMMSCEISNKRVREGEDGSGVSVGWILFKESVNRGVRGEVEERRGLTNSRSVGAFRKTKMY